MIRKAAVKNHEKRMRLMKKQNGKCFYCAVKMVCLPHNEMLTYKNKNLLCTIDHYIPKSKTKDMSQHDRANNIVAACGYCNKDKRNKMIHPLTNHRLPKIRPNFGHNWSGVAPLYTLGELNEKRSIPDLL